MRIAAIFSSPRKNGNSCTIGTSVINGAMGLSTNAIQIFRLNRMFINRGCQHCDECKTGDGCAYNDDFTVAVNEATSCDALIVAVPMYFGHACATYRFFEDKLYSLLDSEMRPRIAPGKKLITIVTCDADVEKAERLRDDIESVYCGTFGYETVGSIVYCAHGDENAAANDPEIRQRAYDLGAVFNPYGIPK